jgi:general secretion pathway protein G
MVMLSRFFAPLLRGARASRAGGWLFENQILKANPPLACGSLPPCQGGEPARRRRGFTLIELLVVLSVIAILLTLAVPRYFGSIDKSKEAVLKENLNQMRDAISRYYADKGKYPESLDSLATDKYLRKVPTDPITESTTTWQVMRPDDPQKGGVYDVKSGAPGKGLDGSEFSQW